ncbi:c-type cytochrome [Lutibacter sp.]
MKTVKILMIIGIVGLGLLSFNKITQEEWKVPEKYEKMKNPTEANEGNLAIGKTLYAKHCKSCHGKTGLGDGPKGEDVDGDLGDFSTKEFQAQSDGTLFYKSYFGRNDMPNYEKKIPNKNDMWNIIHYIRTLEK